MFDISKILRHSWQTLLNIFLDHPFSKEFVEILYPPPLQKIMKQK